MKNFRILGPLIVFIIVSLNMSACPKTQVNQKFIWFLGGHMQHLFHKEYLKPMSLGGYDLKPMHELQKASATRNFILLMADPNASSLRPFSHKHSGIPEIEKENQQLPSEAIKNFDLIIVFEILPHQIQYLKQYPKEKLILFLWEPPSVMPQNYEANNHKIFSKVYTWNDQLVDNQKYYKFHYPVLHPIINDTPPFESKKLCTMIAGNRTSSYPNELYTERHRLISFFENNHTADFDLYGKWWPNFYKTYKGAVDNKINCLKHYKFCIAYENVKNIPGYITEKIFDCFQAGCIPIYWGASNINDYIPSNCFIDRNDFADNAALYSFMKHMSKEQYEQYISNIRAYLSSEKAQIFSSSTFVNMFMQEILNSSSSE